MWIKSANDFILLRTMDLLIICILISMININKISADKHCPEQICASNVSQWCCPYNTICGNQNKCNPINQVTRISRETRCPGETTCISSHFYWCCASDQTCGGFRECKGGSMSTTTVIIIVSILIPVILIVICGALVRYRSVRRANNARMISLPYTNQRPQIPFYCLTNYSLPPGNSFGQIYSISAPNLNREESPPSYDVAVSTGITENQGRI